VLILLGSFTGKMWVKMYFFSQIKSHNAECGYNFLIMSPIAIYEIMQSSTTMSMPHNNRNISCGGDVLMRIILYNV